MSGTAQGPAERSYARGDQESHGGQTRRPAKPGKPITERVARACADKPWRVLAGWLVLVVVSIVPIASLLGDALTSEAGVTTETDSARGDELIEQRLADGGPSDVMVIRSETLTADDPAFRAMVEQLLADMLATGELAGAAAAASGFEDLPVSADGHAVMLPLPMASDDVEPLVEVVEAADGRDGFDVEITGELTADRDVEELAGQDLQEGELGFGLPAALVVLLLVFGTLVAGLLPLLLAILSIVVALAMVSLIGQGVDLSIFVVNMVTGMGLALGIDYCLFILSRFREERAGGRARLDAVGAAGATASRAVLFSGSAFALAMIGMVLVPDTILRSLAVGAIAVGVVSVMAALTLLPALLALLGDRVHALRIPIVGRRVGSAAAVEGRFWSRVVRTVVGRPLVALVVSTGVLLAAAAPILDLDRGFAGVSTLPDRFPSKQGLVALEESFPGATTDPAQIVVAADLSAPDAQAGIQRLRQQLDGRGPYGQVTVEESASRDLAVISIPVGSDPDSAQAVGAVRQLRDELIPAAFSGVDAEVVVTGDSAESVDYFDMVSFWLPVVFAIVLGLSFLLLVLAFRTIVVAAVAIGLNLLSVGAAYGLLVLVFQDGYAAELFGFQHVDAIEAWVPLFLFSVLFGLSMDYQVFLLSRIRERYDQTGNTDAAVVFGVSSTGRIITGAALIIVAVFCGFAAGDLVMFQQMGFGVAVALLIDATLVRSILMPAALAVFGDCTWYLPRWLGWLPRLTVDGPGTSVEVAIDSRLDGELHPIVSARCAGAIGSDSCRRERPEQSR